MLCWSLGSSNTWRGPLLFLTLCSQGRGSQGVGAVAATLVQLEAKGMGVFALPGEHQGGGEESAGSGSPHACGGSQPGESAWPLRGRCPQTSPAGRVATHVPRSH